MSLATKVTQPTILESLTLPYILKNYAEVHSIYSEAYRSQ